MTCPKRITKCSSKDTSKNWITAEIKHKCQLKRELYEGVLNNEVGQQEYKNYCKNLQHEINNQKRSANSRFILNSNNKAKALWTLVKEFTSSANSSPGTHCCINEIEMSSPSSCMVEKLTNINTHLVNMCGSGDSNATVNTDSLFKNSNTIFFTPTTAQEVYGIIKGLKNSDAAGHDNVTVKLIKACASHIIHPLVYLINLCIGSAVFPDELKKSTITLVHKKGNKSSIDNYRPISLLSPLSKVFERVVYARIHNFLQKSNIISNMQNGFVPGRSTERAIYQVLSEILTGLNAGEQTVAVLMDLSKAFDSISHSILLTIMDRAGIRGNGLSLIKSYLSNRLQRVGAVDPMTHEKRYSEWQLTKRGVPQGSILGPLLFVIYINDLPKISMHKTALYADDTTVVIKSKDNIYEEVTATLGEFDRWFETHDLTLNMEKTNIIYFSYFKRAKKQFSYSDLVLVTSEDAKSLGLTIDSQLNWKAHIETLAAKLASYNYALKTVSKSISVEAGRSAYFAYVHSNIKYGIMFWGNSVDSGRIFKLQKMCLRSVFGVPPGGSCRELFYSKGILTVPALYIYECALFVHKNQQLFSDQLLTHQYNTRGASGGYYLPPQTTRASVCKSVVFQIVKVYNHLPLQLKSLNIYLFKKRLHKILVQNTLYKIDEFFLKNIYA